MLKTNMTFHLPINCDKSKIVSVQYIQITGTDLTTETK